MSKGDLGELTDVEKFNDPIEVSGCDPRRLRELLRSMLKIRLAEEKLGELVQSGDVCTPCHLGIGQEAVAVGVAEWLSPRDRVFGGHRSHSQFLAMGGELYGLFAEVLGRSDGVSGGMGGSMHLVSADVGFHGSVPIVGATIPIAVGAALAAKLDGSDSVAVVFFGDGACEEGVFHESLNLASVYALPILFVVENNLFSSHLDIHLRQPSDSVARFATAHRVASRIVDGNDVLAVSAAAKDLIEPIRASDGPGLLEAVTYRFRGHVGPNEDIDVGVRRRIAELEAWKKRCPIRRLERALVESKFVTDDEIEDVRSQIVNELQDAVSHAKNAPFPRPENLLGFVYSAHRQ